ncbi:uncharacterized protein N0V89_009534 [Didymosphaeria variabile]|uniref:Zn(2)-C6 fungal-type domain-containing protein n=1 Tax=Didymosphaeria variabile TaxID=1932322 RepID=A0A9W9C6N1_9PLEO|nr:uncharacterized protein N0V89_009534 [Didymosphaeria variabile]KAJ4348162.1 hypothetical protein N0V89_009534 [Didymosphaeria variabile]
MSGPNATGSPSQEVSSAASPLPAHERKPKEHARIRRRNRIITSCLECRRRKLKCDKQQPCTNCTRFSRPCIFIAPSLDPEAQAKLAEVKEKMGMLEKTLEDDVARRSTPKPLFEAPRLPGQDPAHSDEEDDEDAKDLEFIDIATEHATYYEDEANDDVVDIGIAMGKMRITERVGGLVRPRLSEELNEALKLVPDVDQSLNPYADQSPSSWMSPSADFLAPSSSFYFAPSVEKTTMMTYLPNKVLVDKLLAHYWEVVHPIVRTLHRPSFERKYDTFWRNIASGIEPPGSFQAVVFGVLLQSIVSMSADKSLAEFGAEKQGLVDNFRLGSESALSRANFLRTTKLETLQATVIYLLALCRAEVSRAHSALMGAVIRLAECMGLHRDPSTYSTNPVEVQVRRLIWYQICFLDLRTCEATGPRPQIRRDEYDTRFPLNVEDDDLERAAQRGDNVTQDSKSFTPMTITRMRAECFELYRMIWTERPKLQRKVEPGEKKTTLTGLLGRIQSFRAAMEKAYLPLMSRDNPLHAVAMEMYGILSSRLYLATLHPFASSDKGKMPERLRQIMISSCIMIVEHSMNIEEQPALSQWSWYVGALHQYHSAMLLLSEMYVTRVDPELSARIWRCIDYTFELPSSLGENEKIRFLLSELVERTGSYASLRGVRAPSDMPHAGPRLKDGTSPWPEGSRHPYLPQIKAPSHQAAVATPQATAITPTPSLDTTPHTPSGRKANTLPLLGSLRRDHSAQYLK